MGGYDLNKWIENEKKYLGFGKCYLKGKQKETLWKKKEKVRMKKHVKGFKLIQI